MVLSDVNIGTDSASSHLYIYTQIKEKNYFSGELFLKPGSCLLSYVGDTVL